ncbi:MAG TPA: bifunctional UDP-sugar hydrolase/5'-nucleotidase, partial [Atopobiaceae bacterium]|nr:bifunctional UDP-sugar hydrolase/5'-nucleotidase [Atopobiaceae bacterium]
MATTHITLLHSNDMHGAFLPKDESGVATGGLSLLSGYIRKARKERSDTAYIIAGDMFRGSVIDSEFLGLSTIDLVNILDPDVATIGNHEVDYGLAHLLFLEKCAHFPIINADLYVTLNNARLFQPYINLTVGGLRILCIGIITQEVLSSTKSEAVIGTFVDIKEAAREIGVICDNYRTTGTDLTVLITHVGIEKDRELASMLNPDWGVDLIIGGHSHTVMDAPEIVNGVPIVQAGCGTGQIGRFEIDYDNDRHELSGYTWECVPINAGTAEADPIMEQTLEAYRSTTDKKYKRVVTHLARKLTHPRREQETELGNLYADMLQDESSYDIMLFGSG